MIHYRLARATFPDAGADDLAEVILSRLSTDEWLTLVGSRPRDCADDSGGGVRELAKEQVYRFVWAMGQDDVLLIEEEDEDFT